MLPGLQEAFADAPFSERGWMRALEELARHTGASRAQIIGLGGRQAVPFNYVSNVGDDRLFDQFVDIDGGSPSVNWRVAATQGAFELVWERHYQARRQQGRFDIYDDFAEHYDMPHGCQTLLSNDSDGFLGLATLRSAADGETSEDDRALFAGIAPVVLRAVRTQQALHHQGSQLLIGAMDAMGSATVLLDGRGQVLAMTPSAEREMTLQQCVALRQSSLRAIDRTSDQRLQRAIGRLLPAMAGATAARLWLADPRDHGQGRVCEIYPLPVREWNFGAAPRLMLSLRTLDAQPADGARLLQEAYGFSPAEADVALMIAAGRSRAEVAERRRVRAETVNDQLKSIFRKAEVRRESELVALVTRILG